MENFEFVSPTHFVFGKGAEEQVGSKLAECGARTVLLHFGGQSAVKSGLIDRVKASLDAQGIKHVELGGVRPNPEITLAREGIALCKEHDVDWVLAVGGGSVIDSAKAIAVGAHYDGDVWDFFETKQQTDDVLPIAVVLGEYTVASLLGRMNLQVALYQLGQSNSQISTAMSLLALLFGVILLVALDLISDAIRRSKEGDK
mgnify:CR=1 FL=1